MELVFLIVVAILLLYVAYLQIRLSVTSRPTVVVMPSTSEQDSGVGCVALVLLVLLAVICMAILGVLPPIS
jgi:hypothetical protein